LGTAKGGGRLAGQVQGHENAFLAEAKRVLVLHSYNPGLKWVAEMNKGIEDCFSESSIRNVRIEHEYLDAKRHPEKEKIEEAGRLIRKKYPLGDEFDLIISCDDVSFGYVNSSPDYPFVGVPVSFCGVNRSYYELGKFRNPTTGVLEVEALAENFNYALSNHPNIKKVLFITESNNPMSPVFINFYNQRFREQNSLFSFEIVKDISIHELILKLEKLPRKSIVFLGTFYMDRQKSFFYVDQIMDIIRRTTDAPIYANTDIYLGKGLVGGKLISPYKEAFQAAEYGIQILSGENPANIPITVSSRYRTVFDKGELDRLGIKIDDLPVKAEIINMPPEFYNSYKHEILIGLFFILFLFFVIVVFFVIHQKRNELQRSLNSANEFLDLLVETSKLCSLEWDLPKGIVSQGAFLSHNQLNLFEKESTLTVYAFFRKVHPEDRKKLIHELKKLIYGNEDQGQIQFRCQLEKKQYLWLDALLRVVKRLEDGDASKIILAFKDVTQELEFKEEFQDKSEKLSEAQQIGKLGFWVMSLYDLKMEFSPEVLNIIGLTPDENPVAFKKFLSMVKQEDQEKVCEHVNPTIGLFPNSKELVFGIRVGGELKYLRSQVDADSSMILSRSSSVKGSIIDVTQPQISETEIRRREKWFRSIFELAPLGVVMINSKGEITSINSRFQDMFQIRNKASIPKPLKLKEAFGIIPEDKEVFYNILNGINQSFSFEKYLKRKNNTGFWAEITLSGGFFESNDEAYAIAMVSDISERKEMMNSILSSEKKYRTLIEVADDRIALFDLNQKRIFANSAYFNVLGYNEKEFDQFDLNNLIHPDDRYAVKAAFIRVVKDHHVSFYNRIKHADGRYLYMHSKAVLTNNNEKILVISRDITHLKDTEKKLEEKTRQILMAANLSRLGFAQYYPERNQIEWSEEMYDFLDIPDKRRITPREFFQLVHPDDLKSSLNFFNRIFRNPNMQGTFKFRLKLDDNIRYLHIEAFHKVDGDSGESTIQYVVQDISEIIKNEANFAEN